MCARRTLTITLLSVALFGIPCLVSAAATETPAPWWIEIVRERELPTALATARAAAAEAAEAERVRVQKEEEGKAEEAKEAAAKKVPVKERVKALLGALPKVKPLPDAGEDKPEEGAEEPKPPKAGDEKAEAKPAGADAEGAPADAAAKGEGADKPAAEPPEPEKLTLTVAMAGKIVGLDSSHLLFRPAVRPTQELRLPLNQVTSLSRHAPGREPDAEEPPDLEFRVVLRDGSEVPGQLMSLTDKAMTVALVGSGAKIELPLEEITRVERNALEGDAAVGALPEAPGRHIAALSTGEIVAGQLLPSRDSDKWLRLSSPILTAEAPLSLIDLLIFPDPEAATGGGAAEVLADDVAVEDEGNNAKPTEPEKPAPPIVAEESEPDIRHLVSLSPAGMLWAKTLEIKGDDLLISALGKDSFAVPLDRVESVSFGHKGLSSTAPILVWGGFSDDDDEYKKTLDALKDRIPSRKLLQNKSKVPDGDFMRQLRRSRVLLVPEMEGFKKTELDDAMGKDGKGGPTWGDAFKSFLRRGGNVVFLSPTGEALTFFNSSGLGPLRSGGGGGGWQITAEGRKLGAKIDGKVDNVNATHYYRNGAPWEAWGKAADGGDGVPLLGRRLERGWLMVFGADFYETNDAVTETLVRMLEFRGRR